MSVAIYKNSYLQFVFEGPAAEAWKNAVLCVNTAAGRGAPRGRWKQLLGRYSYTRGNFWAVSNNEQ